MTTLAKITITSYDPANDLLVDELLDVVNQLDMLEQDALDSM